MGASAMQGENRLSDVRFRVPTVRDGAVMFELARESGVLEPNSCYAYLLLCTHFADTCMIAERGAEALGYVAAYRPPQRSDAVFVWQIGVRSDARGQSLGKRMLHALVDLPGCREVRFVEATVAPSNAASKALFRAFARERELGCEVLPWFEAADFGPLAHEPEQLYRIGPIRRDP